MQVMMRCPTLEIPMQIRAGFEIAYDCKQPTPTLLALSVHPSRLPDIAGPHRITFDPAVMTDEVAR